jgi:geranylgeranyl diphosphate synthase, type I
MDGSKGKAYLKDYIQRIRPIVDDFFGRELAETRSEDFGLIATDLLQSYYQMVLAGKGIRGALVELAYMACGGTDAPRILKASTFIELFHSAILIHDDFMDRDTMRRGIETIHKQYEKQALTSGIKIPAEHYGYAQAVNIGDSGMFYSWKQLLASDFPSEHLVEAGKIFSYYIGRLGLGQAMDMAITGNDNISEKEAMKVLLSKTGEYTSILPMTVGAALAGEKNTARLEAIKKYALCFGWAFQIQDDVLGLFAKEQELGKPVGSDLREGKNTLLMIHLRRLGSPEQLEFQKYILGNVNVSSADTEKMKKILRDSGTLDHVLSIGNKYVQEGITYISEITADEDHAATLESLIVYMMERTK